MYYILNYYEMNVESLFGSNFQKCKIHILLQEKIELFIFNIE